MKFLALLPALLWIAPAAAELPPKEVMCRACHGAGGAETLTPMYPKINGQNKAYLVAVLKAYRAGERKGGMSMVMTGQAATLTDAEIEALADFYASQP